jgi:hypothetical protein
MFYLNICCEKETWFCVAAGHQPCLLFMDSDVCGSDNIGRRDIAYVRDTEGWV